MSSLPQKVVVLGVGQLASALLEGWQTAGILDEVELVGVCRSESSAQRQSQRFGFPVYTLEQVVAKPELLSADLWVTAVKPYQLLDLLKQLSQSVLPKLSTTPAIASLAAGISVAQMEEATESGYPVGRVMGNVQWAVTSGVATWCGNTAFNEQAKALMPALFEPVGVCIEVLEAQFDQLTALAGSGPALLLTLLEAMIDGAVVSGLPRPIAKQLVPALFQGVANQVQQTGEHPGVLRDRITTPAGTTMAALMELEAVAGRHAIAKALVAATERAKAYRTGG